MEYILSSFKSVTRVVVDLLVHNHLLGSVNTAGGKVIKCYALSRFLSVGGWGGYRNVNFKLTMIVSPPHDVGNVDTKTHRISHKGRVAAPNWMNFRENPNGLRPPPLIFGKLCCKLFMIDMAAYMQGGMMAESRAVDISCSSLQGNMPPVCLKS